ncbi:MAG: hypothetical protein AB1757_20780 [Acidobacteriota bacterium]
MQNVTLDKVVQEMKTLPSEDLQQLRIVLDELLSEEEKRKRFEQAMLQAGLFSEIRKPKRDIEAFKKYKPVRVKGKPVSETLIEERR